MRDLIFLCLFVTNVLAIPYEKSRIAYDIKPDLRIRNGEEASLGQFPWQAALYITENSTVYFCSGTILSEEWILTAAHCIEDADLVNVYTGIVDLPSIQDIPTSIANETITHDLYDHISLENDIGLLRLSTPLVFDNNTRAISLSPNQIHNNVKVTISGWGSTFEFGSLSKVLTYATLNTLTNGHCEETYGSLFDGALCAVSGGELVQSPCHGDGGAPLVADIDTDEPILAGIFIFISTNGCDSRDPSGYSRIGYYRDWIRIRSGV